MIWKPPSGKALLCHQDAAYVEFLEPKNMTTCWMALDDTRADTGTIFYVRGSNHWPRAQARAARSTRPTTGSATCATRVPGGEELELVPIEVPAGGAAFHDGWTFHGSPPNERADAERRSIISHMVSTETTLERRPAAPDLLALPPPGRDASSTRRSSPCCGARTATARAWLGRLASSQPRSRA